MREEIRTGTRSGARIKFDQLGPDYASNNGQDSAGAVDAVRPQARGVLRLGSARGVTDTETSQNSTFGDIVAALHLKDAKVLTTDGRVWGAISAGEQIQRCTVRYGCAT